ncbi:MAG: ABC transporter permease [Deltaproteobacteria bacterium RBG_19FT_COMBO_46_9]|nr:MAG: ABC transporter permease [Deltaproteobacteria bacterium RBG_19FT_COMBO_46_9]
MEWKNITNSRQYPVILLLLVALMVPFFLENEYILHLLILIIMWTVLGVSWNLLGGYTGQVSFGHAAFFGVGAYTACLLHTKLGVSLWMGLLYAGIAGTLISIPIGAICFRLRGPYFALSVLAFSEVLRLITLHWKSFTEGAVGILLIQSIVSSKVGYYYLILGIAIFVLLVINYVLKKRMGFYFIAVRDDEDAAEALGIYTTRYKLLALSISAFFTGVMGSFFANYTSYIDPYIVFSIGDVSIAMVLVVVLGGIGTFWGPLVGAIVVVLLSEVFRNLFASASVLIYGALIIIVIMFLPQGIVGSLKKRYRQWFHA